MKLEQRPVDLYILFPVVYGIEGGSLFKIIMELVFLHLFQLRSLTWKFCIYVLSRVWLFETPGTVAQVLSVHGISQSRILAWVAISYSKVSSWPMDWTYVSCFSCIGWQVLNHCATWETLKILPMWYNTWLIVIYFIDWLWFVLLEIKVIAFIPAFHLYIRSAGNWNCKDVYYMYPLGKSQFSDPEFLFLSGGRGNSILGLWF